MLGIQGKHNGFERQGVDASGPVVVGVLGALEIRGSRGPVRLDGGIPRTLVARLAIMPNEVVTREALIDALWGDLPPQTARTTFRSHVARLRNQLRAGGMANIISSRGSGYVFHTQPDAVDAHRFAWLADRGHKLLLSGTAAAALEELSAALGLWRGDAFSDCRQSDWVRTNAASLSELRLNAIEHMFRARLVLGEHAMIIGDLEQYVTEFPFRERLWEMKMLALYRSGRRADALATFLRVRTMFCDELGIEPGHELRALQGAMLAGDSTLDMSVAADAGAGRTPAPSQATELTVRWSGNLPSETTSFFGRHAEIAEVKHLLETVRLVTLSGVGGVGKSRLALHVAAAIKDRFPGGVWFVELSDLREPELISQVLAENLEIEDRSHRGLLESVVAHLGESRTLIVLDNCEHVLNTCAFTVNELLRACPGLQIIATSRQALAVPGENVVAVPPLPLPAAGEEQPALNDNDVAIELFASRAAAALPGRFVLDDPCDRNLVARICQRLDGIPLAIELAAVRLRVLSLEQLLQRLDSRLYVLTAGHRAAPQRQRALRATLDWSFDLCTKGEQDLWARLSVFAGSFDFEAAEALGASDDFKSEDFLSLLDGLIDKSVLIREEMSGSVQFRMLDSLREYGRERLVEAGLEKEVMIRHRDYYLGLVKQGDREWFGPGQLEWFDRMRLHRANLRAALDFCLNTPGEIETGLRMAAGLHLFWVSSEFLAEGRYWLNLALDRSRSPTAARAHALWVFGRILFLRGETTEGTARLDEGHRLATALNDRTALAGVTHIQGTADLILGNLAQGKDRLERAVKLHRENGGPRTGLVIGMVHLAMSSVLTGSPDWAVDLCEQARLVCERHGERWVLSYAFYVLSCAEYDLGDLDRAVQHARQALQIKWRFLERASLAMTLDQLGRALAGSKDSRRAAFVLGAALQCWNALGEPWFGSQTWRRFHDEAESCARSDLGDEDFQALFRHGLDCPLECAVATALGDRPI